MESRTQAGVRYCGRLFTAAELDRIRSLIGREAGKNRLWLSRRICEELRWLSDDGRPKDMSCRVAMLRMARDGWIQLPPPEKRNGNQRRRPSLTPASNPGEPLALGVSTPLEVRPVASRQDSSLWNELIERYHYLGYQPLAGAQMRYLVTTPEGDRVAAAGFGAAAWALAPRDRFIGWTAAQRTRKLHLVVQNARFLILPWIRSPNLASRLLSLLLGRLPEDWGRRYGHRPVLVETFVEPPRFSGISYRAANWIHVGRTRGRGKLDRHHRRPLPVKEIFVYPLVKEFRRELCTSR